MECSQYIDKMTYTSSQISHKENDTTKMIVKSILDLDLIIYDKNLNVYVMAPNPLEKHQCLRKDSSGSTPQC